MLSHTGAFFLLIFRSSKTLESSQRIVAETEEIGISVLDTLAQQRESLLTSHDKVRVYYNVVVFHRDNRNDLLYSMRYAV